MGYLERKKWLERNGALEIFNEPNTIHTSGLWVGHGGVMYDTFSHDPVGHLYDQVKESLWIEVQIYG